MRTLAAFMLCCASLSAQPVRAKLTITWQDNSRNETGFELERSRDGVRFQLVALLPANTTSYVDRMLHAGVTYTYRVRAMTRDRPSAWSNTDSRAVATDAVSSRQRSS